MKKNISTKPGMFMCFTILIVLCFFQLNAADERAVNKKDGYMGVGLGMGIPYGVIGINFEFNPHLPAAVNRGIHNYFSVSIGLGLSPGGTAYSVGLRFYPLGREKFYQPRLAGYYGTVALIEYSSGDYDREDGFAFAAGSLFKIGKTFSLDFDTLYIIPDEYADDIRGSRFKISFGIRWHPQ